MTLPILGQATMLLALLVAVVGSACGFVGGRRLARAGGPDELAIASRDVAASPTGDRFADAAARATLLLAGVTGAGMFLLVLAHVGRDFSLAYVAGRTSRDLGLGYRITSVWSGQEGSLLMWLVVLASCGALMVRVLRRAGAPAALLAHAVGVVLAISSFFALLVALVARPFAVVDVLTRDGAGMSPSLQNPWMAAHPPALYLGYVSIAIPFAIVVGSLLARRADDAWVGLARRWTLASWTFLTIGLVLGARWAYEEIGWGGYWAWDPVENAALMPWLTATALIHSTSVQSRRGMLRFWSAALAMLTFGLSIFGTFLTRSGVLSSVHSFVSGPVGWWFLGALAVVVASSLLLLWRSRSLLTARHDVDAVVSRETLLLFNNLLLVALALVVLWGVVYPILTASFGGARISLEKPWYDFFAAAFGIPLAGLVAFAPFVAWQGTPARRVLRSMAGPLALGMGAGVVMVASGLGSSPAAVAAASFGLVVVAGVLTDAVRTWRSRRAGVLGESRRASAVVVVTRHRRRWGAWLAHAGIGLVVVAVAGSAWTTSSDARLERIGDRATVGGYQLELTGVERERDGSRMATRAVFAVSRGGGPIDELRAGRDFHPASGEVSNEVGIRHDWLRVHDLFVTVDRITEDGAVTLQAFVNPLVPLLWLAGMLTALGATIAAWPGRGATNGAVRVEAPVDAVHELRNGTAAPRELLSSLRGAPRRPGA